jgi:hypothetical protein
MRLPLAAETQAFTTTITRVPKHKITKPQFLQWRIALPGRVIARIIVASKKKKTLFLF